MSQTSFFRNTSTTTPQPFGQQRGGGNVGARPASREPTGGRGFGGYSPAQPNSSNAIGGTGFGRYAERPNTNNNTSSNHFQGAPLSGSGRGGRTASAAPGRHASAQNANLTIKPITNAEANPEWIQEEQKFAAAPLPVTANINQTVEPNETEFILHEDDIVKFDSDGPPVVNVQPTLTPFGSNFRSQTSRTGSRTTDRTYDDLPPFGSCKKTIGFGGDGGNRPPAGVGNNRSASVDYGRPSNVFAEAPAFGRQPAAAATQSTDQPKPYLFRSSNAPIAAPTNHPASSAFTPGNAQQPVQTISASLDYKNTRTGDSFGVVTPRVDVHVPRTVAVTTTANVPPIAPFGRQAVAATTTVATAFASAAQTTSVSAFNRPAAVAPQPAKAVSTQTDAPPPSAYVPMQAGTPMRAYPPSPFDGPPILSPMVGSAPVQPVLTLQPTMPGDYSNISVTARVRNNEEFGPRTLRVIHEHRNVPSINAGGGLPLVSSSTSSSSNVSRGRLVSQEMVTELTDSLKQIVRSVEVFGERLRVFADAT